MGKVFCLTWQLNLLLSCFGLSAAPDPARRPASLHLCTQVCSYVVMLPLQRWRVGSILNEDDLPPSLLLSRLLFIVWFAVIWGQSKPLDNPDNIHVLIYRCKEMANNCGMCLSLDKKYQCGWCEVSATVIGHGFLLGSYIFKLKRLVSSRRTCRGETLSNIDYQLEVVEMKTLGICFLSLCVGSYCLSTTD